MVVMLAPPFVLDPPALVPPAHGIVASANTAPAGVTADPHWLAGAALFPLGCSEPTGLRYNCDPAGPLVAPASPAPDLLDRPGEVIFSPLEISIEDQCDSKGYTQANFVGRVRANIEAGTSKAIERDLWTGSGGGGGFFLTDAATLTGVLATTGAGADPVVALAALSKALAGCGVGAKGMIHLPPDVGELVSVNLMTEGQRLVTKSRGDIVVIGSGYTGAGPVGDTNATPPAGSAWAFATSGIFSLALSEVEVLPDSIDQALDRSTNTISYFARRYSMLYGNECCTFAILVDITPADSV